MEGGVDWIDWSTPMLGGSPGYLTMVALAPHVSLGRDFFSGPRIHDWISYTSWRPDFKGRAGGMHHADGMEGWSFGVLMETWW